MKVYLLLIGLLLLTACGKSSQKKREDSKYEPFYSELSFEEQLLVNSLLKDHKVSQKEVIKRILKLKKINGQTLLKLDGLLHLDCSAIENKCTITEKEKT